jgi:hypothetical protein
MNERHVCNTLWLVTAAIVIATVLGWRASTGATESMVRPLPGAARMVRRVPADSIHRKAAFIASHDPFRPDHRPASVAYRPELEGDGAAAPPPPKPPKPRLALAGIVGGPPWTALLDSVPGREGTVLVRKGDTLNGLKVRSVGRDTVVVQGADTVWKLLLKRPWQ